MQMKHGKNQKDEEQKQNQQQKKWCSVIVFFLFLPFQIFIELFKKND